MLIDGHTHISDDGGWFGGPLKAGLADLLGALDRAGVERAVVLPTFGNCRNETVRDACLAHPDRLVGFGTVGTADPAKALAEMERCRDYGLRGLKLHPRFQAFAPLDQPLWPIYERAAELGWPIVFDGFLQSTTVPMAELVPEKYDELAKRLPGLTIILAHMGGHRLWDAFMAAKANPNLYLDISFIVEYFQPLTAKLDELRFMCQGADRKIIYGSDFPSCDPAAYLGLTRRLLAGLPRDKRENIMGANLGALLGPA